MSIRFQEHHAMPVLRGHLRMGDTSPDGETIEVTSQAIERNGKRWIPVMGEYHFSRDARENWGRELAKMRAGGVRVVATYLFWIYHEETEGQFDFSGDLDVRAFLQTCRAEGMEAVIRIGPWAHGECRNGGFPDWLVRKGIRLRDSNADYMRYARRWYERIYAQVKGLFFHEGGPIIGIQFENELVDRPEHLADLKRMALEIGYRAPLYTVTGWNSRFGARIPVDEVLPVFGAYAEAPWAEDLNPQPLSSHYAFYPERNDAAIGMDQIRDRAEDGWRLPYERYPYATCELGSGLQSTHHRRVVMGGMDAYALSLVKLGCGNNLIGYYMYHGGTNKIGKLSTFQESKATGYPNDVPILDYDFHTCLSQYGQAREQYGLLNLLHLFAEDFGEMLSGMDSVAAEDFVPCTDLERLRCAFRTDGKSGFVFVNHYQRRARLRDVNQARIEALGVRLPPMDVKGDAAFFLPVRMRLDGTELRYATAQPICRMGDAWFFAEVAGIAPEYCLVYANGRTETVRAQAGLNPGFERAGCRIVTLSSEQAGFLRRLNGQIYVGLGCNLYWMNGEVQCIEDGSFAFAAWEGDRFETKAVNRHFIPAVLSMEDAEEPFTPPYEEELNLGSVRRRWWRKMTVSSPEGFVQIDGEYDTAQIYADGQLAADHFYIGEIWQVPALLLYGRECYLVMSELKDDCYLESRNRISDRP